MHGAVLDLQPLGDRCMTTARLSRKPLSNAVGVTLIIAVAIGGLFYVKWLPYFSQSDSSFHQSFDRSFHLDGRCRGTAAGFLGKRRSITPWRTVNPFGRR